MPVTMPPMPLMSIQRPIPPAKGVTEISVRCNFASTAIFGMLQVSYFWTTEKAQQAGGPNIAAHRETKHIDSYLQDHQRRGGSINRTLDGLGHELEYVVDLFLKSTRQHSIG